MNQTPGLAAALAADPPAELQQLLKDPRTTDSAREAVADIVKPPATTSSNGHKEMTSRSGDGRLQVVDEKQDFT
jgi:hypothetical protein